MNPPLPDLLQTLTPAESCLLIDPKGAKRRQLIQLTIADLLYRKVLKFTVDTRSEESDIWIELGRSPGKYAYKPHETIMVRPLEKQPGNRLLFKAYIKMIVERSWPDKRFKFEVVASSGELAPFFRQTGLKRWFQIHGLNHQGEKSAQTLQKLLQEAQNHINEAPSEEMAREFVSSLGSHALLLDGMEKLLAGGVSIVLKGKFNSITEYIISLKDTAGETHHERGKIDSHVNYERTGFA